MSVLVQDLENGVELLHFVKVSKEKTFIRDAL